MQTTDVPVSGHTHNLYAKGIACLTKVPNRSRSRLECGGGGGGGHIVNISRVMAYVLRPPCATYVLRWLLHTPKRQERCMPFL